MDNISSLLDVSIPYDQAKVQLLERVVTAMYAGTPAQKKQADEVLRAIKEKESAWIVSDSILELSQDLQVRHFAASLLEDAIKGRWRLFSSEQKLAIRGYLVQLILKIASDEATASAQRTLLNKLNSALVQIVKNDWPSGWPDFISEICSASKHNQTMCENNFKILTILSQEVFEFGKDSMTTKRVFKLRETLANQFSVIYDLCMFVFSTALQRQGAVKPSLIQAALSTLQHFICFIPSDYIFGTEIVPILITHFVEPVSSRIEAIKCLGEVFALKDIPQKYFANYIAFLQKTLEKFAAVFPENINSVCAGSSRLFWEVCVNQAAVLLTNSFKNNLLIVHEGLSVEAYQYAVSLVLKFTQLPNEETMKICLDFWMVLVVHFFQLHTTANKPQTSGQPLLMLNITTQHQLGDQKMHACNSLLAQLRRTLIARMAKPPEVVIKETEDGEIIREEEQDTDELAVYKTMREVLVYLTNLDNTDTETTMRSVLLEFIQYTEQYANRLPSPGQKGTESWSSSQLNKLCWAIGSISGALPEEREKPFLVEVLRHLLGLCEKMQGKEYKAIVASNLLYVVGQYPRFLKAHWKFLKTLVVKLFEFLHEPFPGVQEMTVNTFLKVADKCRKKFVIVQPGESTPFVEDIISKFQIEAKDLNEPLLICTFYEAVGCLIQAVEDPNKQDLYISTLLHPLSQEWSGIITQAASGGGLAVLTDLNNMRKISLYLRVLERLCFSVGQGSASALHRIYNDMLQVYRLYSEKVAEAIAMSGTSMANFEHVKMMRKIKRDCLRLVATFVEKSVQQEKEKGNNLKSQQYAQVAQLISTHIIPPLLEPVLGDYARSNAQARDAEVLVLLSAVTKNLTTAITPAIPEVFDRVFVSTLDMLKTDQTSFPDHRQAFFELLQNVNRYAFNSLFLLPNDKLSLFVESAVFAMKHQHPKIADIGCLTLVEFLESIHKLDRNVCLSFYSVYYQPLAKEVLGVLTDRLHKSGFAHHARLLNMLVQIVNRKQLEPEVTNQRQVMELIMTILASSFTTVTQTQLEAFVLNLFAKSENPKAFAQVLKDFLISVREHSGDQDIGEYEDDKKQAFEELQRAAQGVPGMAPPDAYSIDNEIDFD